MSVCNRLSEDEAAIHIFKCEHFHIPILQHHTHTHTYRHTHDAPNPASNLLVVRIR